MTGEKSILVNKHAARALEAHCNVVGVNPTGPVESGFIRLLCRWVPRTLNIGAVSEVSDETSFLYSFDGLPIKGNGRLELFWPDVPLVKGMGCTAEGGLAETILRSNLARGTKRPSFRASVSCVFIGQLSSKHFILIYLILFDYILIS